MIVEKLGERWNSGSCLAEWQGGDLGSQFSFWKNLKQACCFHPCSMLLLSVVPGVSCSKPSQNSISKLASFSLPSCWLLPSIDMRFSTVPNPLSILLPFYLLFNCHFSPSLIIFPFLLFLYIGSCILKALLWGFAQEWRWVQVFNLWVSFSVILYLSVH